MHTVQIILQLIDAIRKNPSAISSIPWEDMVSCISIELTEHSHIYSLSHMQEIEKIFNDLLTELSQSAAAMNSDSLIARLQQIAHLLQVMPELSYVDKLSLQSNFNHACLRHYKKDTIIVLGDSHVNFFSGNELLSFLPIGHEIDTCVQTADCPFTALHTGPNLAYTSNKKDTTYHFQEKVTYLCQSFIKPGAQIICSLGEIDLRVHVFQQTELQNKTYMQIVDNILVQYGEFLSGLREQGYIVYCWGPIASQSDSCPLDPKFPRIGSETDRNKATAYFTEKLRLLCEELNIGFLSIFEQMITPDYRTIEKYLSPDHCHLSQSALPLAKQEWQKLNNFKLSV